MIKALKWQIIIGLLMALGVSTFSCLPEKPKPAVPHIIKKRSEKNKLPPPAKPHNRDSRKK